MLEMLEPHPVRMKAWLTP